MGDLQLQLHLLELVRKVHNLLSKILDSCIIFIGL